MERWPLPEGVRCVSGVERDRDSEDVPPAFRVCQDYFKRGVALTLGLAPYPGYSVS